MEVSSGAAGVSPRPTARYAGRIDKLFLYWYNVILTIIYKKERVDNRL